MKIALARRYRPRTFETMVGQEVTLCALSNALETKRLHHAYLFTGTRGVGKTTVARILAKCLNCEKGITSTPCGQCAACQAIDKGTFVDLIEVDAASRTKVEDTRELLNNVQYLPTCGRFKIYIIDEVHMLSGHSFNALLKTLEEPPPHVKFLLATTDPQKLPVTVLSRCLQFHLWRLSINTIAAYLANILQQEGVSFEKEALQELSRSADGSLRDALSLLDQALAYGNGHIETTAVRTLLGLTEREHLVTLLEAVVRGDGRGVLNEINLLAESVPDFAGLLTEFQEMIHQVVIAQSVPEALDENVGNLKAIINLATKISAEELQLYYQITLQGQRDLPYAPSPKMGFEMILLRMVAFQPVRIGNFIAKNSISDTAPVAPIASSLTPIIIPRETEKPLPRHAEDTPVWSTLVKALNLTGLTKLLAENCVVESWSSHYIVLTLDNAQKPLYNKRYEDRLTEILSQYFGRELRLKINLGKVQNETPAKQNQRMTKEAHLALDQKNDKDPKIQSLLQAFDAKIEQVTLKDGT